MLGDVTAWDDVAALLCADASIPLSEVRHVIVGSVVPTLTPAFVELASRYLGTEAVVVGPGIKTGMALRYDNPREIGADRLVYAVAAYVRV